MINVTTRRRRRVIIPVLRGWGQELAGRRLGAAVVVLQVVRFVFQVLDVVLAEHAQDEEADETGPGAADDEDDLREDVHGGCFCFFLSK